MSIFSGNGSPMVATGAARYSSVSTGRIQGGVQSGITYPNPFFDVAHTYLPQSVKSLFRWARYYFLTNPILNQVAYRQSEYPVTDLTVKHEDESTRKRWSEFLLRTLRLRSFKIGCGLDYNVYGNTIVTIAFPFVKWLMCPNCKRWNTANRLRPYWKLQNFLFRLRCPGCQKTNVAVVKDVYVQNPNLIRLIRHNPEYIDTTYNELSGTQLYFYTLPNSVRNDIVIGRQDIIEQTPQIYLQAIAEQKAIVFSQDNVFHLKRPGLADSDRAWGSPPILPLLKDLFGLQLLKKAQETITLEHVLPLRVLFPQGGSGSSDPYTTIGLAQWKEQVAAEIQRWKMDRNYMPILPLPIGNQTLGGDGRAMFLTNEIMQAYDIILAGFGTPKEFIFGGMSWSGASASIRMFENSLLRYMERLQDLDDWVVQRCADFLRWPVVEVASKPFRAIDDLQRKSLEVNLQAQGLLSGTTVLDGMDHDFTREMEMIQRENHVKMKAQESQQISQAKLAGEVSLVTAQYQAKAAAIMQPPAPPQDPNAPPPDPNAPPPQLGAGAPPGEQPPMDNTGGAPGGQEALPTPEASMGQAASNGAVEASGQSIISAAPTTGGGDLIMSANLLAKSIAALPEPQRAPRLEQIRMMSEPMAELVSRMLSQLGAEVPTADPEAGLDPHMANGVDMRPMPELLPPRRQT